MTFLNATLIIGTIAGSIPFIIHLLNKNRYRTVAWGAMHLLEPAVRVNRKRIRIEQLILLLIRTAIPIILAICMAGPVITGWKPLVGDAMSSLVLVFDNSYSMDAGTEATTNLQRAATETASVLRRQRRGSDVATVLMSGGELGVGGRSTTDLTRVAEELELLETGAGQADIVQSFESAVDVLGGSLHSRRDVLIVSDFQASDWSDESAPARQRLTELIASDPIPPSVTLMRVAPSDVNNVSIQSLDLTPDIPAPGQFVTIRANLRNHGDEPWAALRVFLTIDGEDIDAANVDLGANEDGQVVFRHRFENSGPHLVEVKTDADTLTADNVYASAVRVWDHVPVLLVDGDPSDEPLEGATEFLQLALTPFGASSADDENKDPADLVTATEIRLSDLSSEWLKNRRVAIVANVDRLTEQQLKAVEEFVADGNALIVFPGDQVDADWYNEHLFADGRGLLPLALTELRSRVDTRTAAVNSFPSVGLTDDIGARIVAEHFEHPALQMFNDLRNGNPADAVTTTWFQVDEPADEFGTRIESETTSVPARFENGDAFLVEKRYGRGRVIFCTTSCNDAWTNLPVRPVYVPLMQRLVTWLASSGEPPLNVDAGRTLVATIGDEVGDGPVRITTPDGEIQDVVIRPRGSSRVVEFADTHQPGVYRVSSSADESIAFAVHADRTESDLTRLTNSELDDLAGTIGANVVTSAHEYFELDSTRRYGRDITRHLWWLLLLFLIAEVVLQQFFSRSVRAKSQSPAPVAKR